MMASGSQHIERFTSRKLLTVRRLQPDLIGPHPMPWAPTNLHPTFLYLEAYFWQYFYRSFGEKLRSHFCKAMYIS